MNNNQFYKMPADILQAECVQAMLHAPGALSQFGLTMLVWLTIQETRDKRVSRRFVKNAFAGISSEGQRNKLYESGFFIYDESTDSYSINPKILHTGVHSGEHTGEHSGIHTAEHSGEHSGEHTAAHTQVPFHDNLEIELEIEGEGDTRETTTPNPEKIISEVKGMDPHKGELWIGVLLYCPDQELRRTMLEHWVQTMGYIEQHLKSSGRIDEVKDTKSLFAILQELVQPKSPIFGGLKLFLMQDAKSETEKAFDKWLSGLSNICQMQQPLTYAQLQELGKAGYSAAQIRQTAERLNNYPNTPYKYVSAYQTIKEWLQNPKTR